MSIAKGALLHLKRHGNSSKLVLCVNFLFRHDIPSKLTAIVGTNALHCGHNEISRLEHVCYRQKIITVCGICNFGASVSNEKEFQIKRDSFGWNLPYLKT